MAIVFSIMAGCFGVIQSGLNKMISDHWGFSSALLLNGLVFLVFNFLLFSVVYFQPQIFSSEYRLQGSFSDFKLWWILPGICGFMLVMGLAVSLAQVGAVQTFVICIAAQIVCSLLWDLVVEGKEIAVMRLAGAAITFFGAFLATRG
ncbi:DMT family transporter [bacterium]|nr:DMT family transporter [bacterium]